MAAVVSGLTNEDREALWMVGMDLAETVEAVDQIVARHVTEARVAALEEAARAIEAPWLAAPNPSPEMRLFTHAHAGIVRNLAATPPP